MKRWTRRRFLRGVTSGAAITLALPWLECSQSHAQAGGAFPTRFGLFCWGNGVLPDRWVPSGAGMGDHWTLSEQLTPLAPVKEKITVVTGMSIKTANVIPHHSGMAGILTGRPLVVHSHEDQSFDGSTVDQLVADAIGGVTRFKSLEFGAEGGVGQSHSGASINPADGSPRDFFLQVFGPDFRTPGDMRDPDPKLALRRSVLDAVMTDLQSFKRGIGSADLARLDQHLEGLRGLERRIEILESDPPSLAACRRVNEPENAYDDIEGRPQLSVKNRILCDIAVMALACDQTRVISNFITRPLTNKLFANATSGHHQLTHDEPNPQPQVNAIVLTIMEELKYYLEALDSIQEGDGTLLDHMALLATSDVSYGRTHSLDEFPLIIAGGANGRLKTNLHYRSALAENTSHAILSVMQAAGTNTASFGGQEGRVETGLSPIEV